MPAGGGDGGAAAPGWVSRDEAVDASAVIWDVRTRRPVHVAASETGTTTIPGLILPVPLPAWTESRAIDALAERVVDAVDGPRGDRR